MAYLFRVQRAANKITMGTTDTTIVVESHTASQLLGLDASKNLESVTSPILTDLTLTGFTGILWSNAGTITGDATLDKLDNLAANKTFNNAARSISFNFTNPTNQPTYDGAFEIQASGTFAGDLLHVHQHTGNPGTTDLIHAEATDADVTLLRLYHSVGNAICLAIGGHGSNVATIDTEGDALFNTLSITSVAAEGSDVDKFLVDSSNVVKYRTGAEVLADIGGSASGHNHDATYQPLDAVLTDIAALSVVADNEFIVGTGAGVYAHESGATARTSIGLGTGDSPTFANLTLGDTDSALIFAPNDHLQYNSAGNYYLFSIGNVAAVRIDSSGPGGGVRTDYITEYAPDHGVIIEGVKLVDNHIRILNGEELRFYDAGSSHYVGFEAPALTANQIWVLPNADGDNTNVLQTNGSGVLTWVAAAGADSEKVKVDVGATADYIGAANSDGVLRTTTGLSYADGGNFVTLGLSHLGFESLTSPTPNDRIPFWDESGSSFAWLSPSTGLSIDATSLGLNFGALSEETTPDILDVVCIYDPTGGAHHKVALGNLKALSAYTDEDSNTDAMLVTHAYLAATDGWVSAYTGLFTQQGLITLYVETATQYGIDSDPTAGGDIIEKEAGSEIGQWRSVSAFVAKGEYFEIRTTYAGTATIRWKSIGTLSKPVDQD